MSFYHKGRLRPWFFYLLVICSSCSTIKPPDCKNNQGDSYLLTIVMKAETSGGELMAILANAGLHPLNVSISESAIQYAGTMQYVIQVWPRNEEQMTASLSRLKTLPDLRLIWIKVLAINKNFYHK